MESGFYKKLSMADYHAAPGLSKSALSNLAVSPAHYKYWQTEPKKFAAADLGTAVHLLILEPEIAEKKIVTPPLSVLGKNGARNTNAYRDWKYSLTDEIVLTADECDAAQYMRDAVMAHPRYADLLTGGNAEVSAFWTDENGLTRKTRPDYLNDAYAVNLKTALSAHPAQFGRQAASLHYHWDAAWFTDICMALTGNRNEYVFFVVEKEAPYAVACYSTPQDIIEMARKEIAPIVVQYRVCFDTGIWPGYSNEIETLELPRWATYKKED